MKKYISLKNGVIFSIILFLFCWLISAFISSQSVKTPLIIAIPLLLSLILFVFCVVGLIIKLIKRMTSPSMNKVKDSLSPYVDNVAKNIKDNTNKSKNFIQQVLHDRNEKKKQIDLLKQERRAQILAQQKQKKLVTQKKNNDLKIKKHVEYSQSNNFKMINGEATIWEGTTKPASFSTFDKKLQGVITRLILKDDGEFYIDITDTETGEIFTAKEIEIRTKIKVGSTSYDFVTLCRNPLKINLQNMFSFAEEVRSEARKPMLIKTFDPIDVSFTYTSKENGKARRTVTVTKYYRNKQGGEYFQGHCHSRNEERMFKASNMDSKLKVGKNYYFFNEFVDNFVNEK